MGEGEGDEQAKRAARGKRCVFLMATHPSVAGMAVGAQLRHAIAQT